MPHLLVEYSKNIAERLSLQALSDELRDATMATGTYPLKRLNNLPKALLS